MFELLDSTEHKNIASRLRLRDSPAPPQVVGTLSTQRPDLACRNGAGKMVIVESVTKEDMIHLDDLKERLYLFYTAAQCYGWDFHVVCYKVMQPHVKNFCYKNGIRYSKLWDL